MSKTDKRAAAGPGETDEEAKRPRLSSTDVVVVVGGKEFEEESTSLSSWSEYFKAALQSGMKEAETKRFEFPDKDPDEWELVVALSLPYATEKITMENIDKVLPWLDFLGVSRGLEACDEVLAGSVLDWRHTGLEKRDARVRFRKDFCRVVDVLTTSLQYNLPETKDKAEGFVACILYYIPLHLKLKEIQKVWALLQSHKEPRKGLFDALQAFLPRKFANACDEIEEKDHDALLQNEYLPEIIRANIVQCALKEQSANLGKVIKMQKEKLTKARRSTKSVVRKIRHATSVASLQMHMQYERPYNHYFFASSDEETDISDPSDDADEAEYSSDDSE